MSLGRGSLQRVLFICALCDFSQAGCEQRAISPSSREQKGTILYCKPLLTRAEVCYRSRGGFD